ncbi:MAG TPA: FG-GAP-like repeat-containing protein, partial [Blastocatellia bacterium]
MLSLVILGVACHRTAKLPDPGSQQYRDACRAFYVGLAALQAGDDRRAEDELTKATQLAPGEPAAWADLGILSLKDRDFDPAAKRLEKAADLSPDNSRIIQAQANLASSRGDHTAATKYLRQVIKLDPKNLKAIYSLAEELETQGGNSNELEAQQLMRSIVDMQPDNLAVLLELTRLAAKRGDTATLQSTISRMSSDTASWPRQAREQLLTLQSAAAGSDMRLTGQRVAFLRNVLVSFAGYRTSLSAVKLPTGETNEPFIRFIKLPSPSPSPAAMDEGLTFNTEPIPEFAATKWSWAGTISLNGEGSPVPVVANGSQVRLKGQTLTFPGGPSSTPPTASGVLALDYNYDFRTDFALAGAGGFKLYRQEESGVFTDQSASLPGSITGGAYWGVWTADLEMNGNLDIILATVDGPIDVLRNNGDGTFTEEPPFNGVPKVRGFAWADLDGDGAPDAVLLSADGTIHVFMNERAGLFRSRPGPTNAPAIAAINVADVNGNGVMDLIAAGNDGSLISISDNGDGTGWNVSKLTDAPRPALTIGDFSGQIIVADLDNNGASDLVCSSPAGSA